MPLGSIQIVTLINSLSLFLTEQCSALWMHLSLSRPWKDFFGLFPSLASSTLVLFPSSAAVIISYRFLCRCKFLFLWNKCSGMQLLGYTISVCLVGSPLRKLPKYFSKWLYHFIFLTHIARKIQFPHSLTSRRFCHY